MWEVILITVIIVMFMMAIVANILTSGEVIFIAGIIGMFMLALLADILIQVTVFKSRKSSKIGRRGNIFKRSGNKNCKVRS